MKANFLHKTGGACAFPQALNLLGIFVGLAGVSTIYPLDIFTEIFGLGQIVWFLWIVHL